LATASLGTMHPLSTHAGRVSPTSLAKSVFLALLLQPAELTARDVAVDGEGTLHWLRCGSLFAPLFHRCDGGLRVLGVRNVLFTHPTLAQMPLPTAALEVFCTTDFAASLLLWLIDLRIIEGDRVLVPAQCMPLGVCTCIYVCVCVCVHVCL
jgi:hypothetical protein